MLLTDMGAEEFSISEYQKLTEFASSSDEAEEGSQQSQEPLDHPEPESDPSEEASSDEEVEVDINNLGALATKSERKAKPSDIRDIDSLFSNTRLKRKEESELSRARELRKEQISRHFARLEGRKQEKRLKEVTFKEWHVPLMEVPKREEPRPKRRKAD